MTTITLWLVSVAQWFRRPSNVTTPVIKFGNSRVAIDFNDEGGFTATLGAFSTTKPTADTVSLAQAVIDVTQQRAAAEFVRVARARMIEDAARLLGN